MRIAYLSDPNTANGFYRAIGPMTNLAYLGHQVTQLSTLDARAQFAAVRNIDLLHVHRYCDVHALPLIREAKAHGGAVVWDDDDDTASIPKGSPAYQRHGGLQWERRLSAIQKTFVIADLVTSTNATLAARFSSYGASRTTVIENHVPGLFLQQDRRPHAGMTIGWVAGKEHMYDADLVPIEAALQRLLDERHDVTVVSLGLRLRLKSERYQWIERIGILELADHTAAFDIGLAPLADSAFNRSRSNIKLKEYAAGGTAWLASPVGPYMGMNEAQGGRLVADDRWYEEIGRLLDKPRKLAKLAKRARAWVRNETIERNGHRWEAAFAVAMEHA